MSYSERAKKRSRTIRAIQRAQQREETPEEIAARLVRRAAAETVNAERLVLYPVLTAENINEALAWQEARLRELTT